MIRIEEAAERLVLHEGMRLKPYRCPAGKLTIGAGRNLEDNPLRPEEAEYLGRVSLQDGISREEALFLLHNDIRRTEVLLITVHQAEPEIVIMLARAEVVAHGEGK